MLPIYRDPWFTFRFAEDRIIPRIHLEGVPEGQPIAIYKIDPDTGSRQARLAQAVVGLGGWVDLPGEIIMRAGEAFVAALENDSAQVQTAILHHLTLVIEKGLFAICKLASDSFIPPWATAGALFSITRTAQELSIVCAQEAVPDGVQCEPGWRCLRVAGALPFNAVGVLASLTTPLAQAGISIFAISTFDTDCLLVKAACLDGAMAALRAAGHAIDPQAASEQEQ